MLRTPLNIARLFRILRALGRHGVLPDQKHNSVVLKLAVVLFQNQNKPEGLGVRLAAALQELGPSFVKFGQSLAVRSDLIGDQVADELALLQDRLPPFAGDEAVATIEAEFKCDIKGLFNRFDIEPIAAASISQVHLATTVDGAQVAVKILRPGIEEAFAKDLELFVWLAEWVECLLPSFARFKLREVVGQFEKMVAAELDLRLEAASASELAGATKDDFGFKVPAVDWSRTAQRVLTIEWIDGIRIDDVERIEKANLDREAILKNSASAFFNQVFRDGFFHADMHPGNMFVLENGTIVPVDFGIMGRLDRATRYYLADMLLGFLQRDYKKVADVHFDAGLVPPNQSRDAFALAIRSVAEPIFDHPMQQISIAGLLARLFQTAETFQIEIQPQLLLLQKTMLVAEGVGRKLDPQSNMWMLSRPLIETWMRRHRGPEARLHEGIETFAGLARRLPRLVEQADTILCRLANENNSPARQRSFLRAVFGIADELPWRSNTVRILLGVFLGLLLGYYLN
jgi:ubiquinone biosynthesis protein